MDEGIGVTEAGLFGDGGPVAGADERLLDRSVVQRLGGDFLHVGRVFAFGQRLRGAQALAADGGEEEESVAGVGAEAALATFTDGFAVGPGRRWSKQGGFHPIACTQT